MNDDSTTYLLRIHQTTSEELRHTATIIWQFSIAILTLQGGAFALSKHKHYGVLVMALFLSVCFSLLLVRQTSERRAFVERIKAVEDELRRQYPTFFIPVASTLSWFTSGVLAWILATESVIGFFISLARAFHALCGCR